MDHTLPGGFLIAIEGIDGAGKTTLAEGLAQALGHGGATVHVTKEPTRGPWGMRLRASAASGRLTPQDEADFLIRDRREHVDGLIAPALARGECVILDRYYPSMVAYQGAAGLDVDELMRANDFAPRPDVLLLLDVAPDLGLQRIRERGDVPNAFETTATLEACRRIFLAMDVPGKHVLDAARDAEAVLQDALWIITRAVADKARRTLPPVEAVGAIGAMLPDLQTA
jgi:dTMP kinase